MTKTATEMTAETAGEIIRGQEMRIGDDIRWMSGGTWDGKILSIEPYKTSVSKDVKHAVTIKATNGEVFTLRPAEHYGINLGRSKFIESENRPSYLNWQKDYPDIARCAAEPRYPKNTCTHCGAPMLGVHYHETEE